MMTSICNQIIFSAIKTGENLPSKCSTPYLSGSWHSPWPGEPDIPLRIVIDCAIKKVPVIQERFRGRWRSVDAKDHAYIEATIFEQFEEVHADAAAFGLTATEELPQWADEAPSPRQKNVLTAVQQMMETAGWMRHAYDAVIAQQVERYGDTVAVRRKAATLAFEVFRRDGYSQATARSHLIVHKRFSDNDTAIRVFKWGELAMLASQTDEHVNALIEAKLAEPEMSRDEIKRYLDQLRSQMQ
ncbi:hypothetical protein [Caballeronia sp. dw_19]|uniref:hypothetical protein n=1 Tax=Caballeronia sp. dw_19 TaxID=2719791 RepID=UPI001BD50553|nr:hypothetical protein [Caballeronia sp. dw_19]